MVDEYIPERVKDLKDDLWVEAVLALLSTVLMSVYIFYLLFRTSVVLSLLDSQSVASILSIAYTSGSIYEKLLIVLFSVVFCLSIVHSIIHPLLEAYRDDLDIEDFLGTVTSTMLGLLYNTSFPLVFGVIVYYVVNNVLVPLLSITLTDDLFAVLVIFSLFVGIYSAEFTGIADKNRSMFTSVMYLFISDGITIYETGLNKYLLLLGLLFTYEGGRKPLQNWRSDSILVYKQDGTTLIAAFPTRRDIDNWLVEGEEVSSSCSLCGMLESDCLRLDEALVVGSDLSDTSTKCTCQDCHNDILRKAVSEDYIDESEVITHKI